MNIVWHPNLIEMKCFQTDSKYNKSYVLLWSPCKILFYDIIKWQSRQTNMDQNFSTVITIELLLVYEYAMNSTLST